MSSPTTSLSAKGNEYDEKKREFLQKLKSNQIEAVDFYILAALLAMWKPNNTLPVCLLCQEELAPKNGFGLGHLIPHSILKECQLKYFAHLNQGRESGVSNMGYRAFCVKCEKRFSDYGEVHLNPKFFKPFLQTQDEGIEVNVLDENKNPWLYFSFISIIWRALCFIPRAKEFLNPLEYLRSFLLKYPNRDDDIDSKVTLFVFAPNSQLDSKVNGDNQAYIRYFEGMATVDFDYSSENAMVAWVFMGPIHILMVYNGTGTGTGSDWIKSIPFGISEEDLIHASPFGLSRKDLEQAKQTCIIRSTDCTIAIKNKDERFFPMSVYPRIVSFGNKTVSATTRIPPPKQSATNLTGPSIQATCLHLLPKDVVYYDGEFALPAFFERKFSDDWEKLYIVGACRGKGEKIIFVACEAIKYIEDGQLKYGPLTMALNVDDNGKVKSYLKDVNIPSKEKCGQDLKEIPYKQLIEKAMENLMKKNIVKW